MRTLQLYATGSATASAVAQVTIPTAGRIKGVQLQLTQDTTTDGGRAEIELSKVATSQIAVNGAQDPFLHVGLLNNLTTSGVGQTGVNQFFPLDVQVRQGEIIYLHALVSNSTYFATCIIHYA